MPSLDILIPAYNAAHCLDRTLAAIFDKPVPAGLEVGVIVVDNRSTDATGTIIDDWAANGVTRVDCGESRSRSAARNAGAAASHADYLLLLDADCELLATDSFTTVADAISGGTGAGFGFATGTGSDFWARYFRRLEIARRGDDWRGWTSACMLVDRNLYNAIGGFSTDYTHYGFEDRDFICALLALPDSPALEPLPRLRASHNSDTSAAEVLAKIYESARFSSGIFRRRFPAHYARLSYARVDVDTASRAASIVLRILLPLRPGIAATADWASRRDWLPLAVGSAFLRLGSALSYFRGTLDRGSDR